MALTILMLVPTGAPREVVFRHSIATGCHLFPAGWVIRSLTSARPPVTRPIMKGFIRAMHNYILLLWTITSR